MKSLKRFVDTYNNNYDEFTLSLDAGSVDKDGCICNSQLGIQDTFAVGMPVYGEDGREIGRLSIGLFQNLNYSDRAKGELKIPVEFWKVEGYKSQYQKIRTYHQMIALNDTGQLK